MLLNTLFLISLAISVSQGSFNNGSIYFPVSILEISLPTNIWSLPSVPVVTTRALFEQRGSDAVKYSADDIRYYLNSTVDWVTIDTISGHVTIHPEIKNSGGGGGKKVVVRIDAHHAKAGTAHMKLLLYINNKTLDCKKLTKEFCHWKNATYQFYENQPSFILSELSPSFVKILCPKLSLTYELVEGKEIKVVKQKDGNWVLETFGPQDREAREGSKRINKIKCSKGGHSLEIDINMAILDQDDNEPYVQKKQVIIILNSTFVHKDESPVTKDLVFRDNDTKEVNSYEIQISDYLNLLKANFQQWSVPMKPQSSLINCEITFKHNASIPNYYTAILSLDDISLIPGIKKTDRKVEIKILFRQNEENITETSIEYPKTIITLTKNGAIKQRIVEPIKRVNINAKFKFKLNDVSKLFGVTEHTGIVFLAHKIVSDMHDFKLTIEWSKLNITHHSDIHIKILDDKKSECDGVQKELCAIHGSKKSCSSSCGYSISNFCQWRSAESNNSQKRYSTCSPDTITCPDGFCDELEDLNDYICPQDCTRNHMASQKPNGERGIKSGFGICTCNVLGSCSCFSNAFNNGEKSTTKRPNTSKTTATPLDSAPTVGAVIAGRDFVECGDGCLLSLVLGSLLFFSGITVVVLWIRRRRMFLGIRAKRKFTARANRAVRVEGFDMGSAGGNTSLSEVLTEPETLENNKRPSNLSSLLTPDPKWEFPREKLRIEQVLGEGEFGRVVKASARDLPGAPSMCAVAVKTLKDGAGNTELTDLLSEYELLKEVNHPNVIKLLGACTSSGGPIYIIIEYAEHGSLRNYLRRSRKLETGNSEMPPNPMAPITPREILSFAWQISKGMSYLSEIKLVHRDLAARNVLVATGGICKVSDFGLTRDVYEDDAYFKRSKGRVPVKWMAIESLADNIYTSKSDVWSFGILLWELVTLGSSPYPGVEVQNLYHLLRAGYRMERPENCSHPLYRLMRVCWEADTLDRPTFKDITMLLDGMLQDGADYLDLYSQQTVHNRGYVGTDEQTVIAIAAEVSDDNLVRTTGYENEETKYETPLAGISTLNYLQLSQASETEEYIS